MTIPDAQVAAIAAKLTKRARKVMTETPHPQPMEGHWFWAGSTAEAIIAARAGLIDGEGWTPLGLAVRAHIQDHSA